MCESMYSAILIINIHNTGASCGSNGKASACDAGDQGSTPGFGNSYGEGNGSPHQYSRLEISMDREAWRAVVHDYRVRHD